MEALGETLFYLGFVVLGLFIVAIVLAVAFNRIAGNRADDEDGIAAAIASSVVISLITWGLYFWKFYS